MVIGSDQKKYYIFNNHETGLERTELKSLMNIFCSWNNKLVFLGSTVFWIGWKVNVTAAVSEK